MRHTVKLAQRCPSCSLRRHRRRGPGRGLTKLSLLIWLLLANCLLDVVKLVVPWHEVTRIETARRIWRAAGYDLPCELQQAEKNLPNWWRLACMATRIPVCLM